MLFTKNPDFNKRLNVLISICTVLIIIDYGYDVFTHLGTSAAYVAGFLMMLAFGRNYIHLQNYYRTSYYDPLTELPNRVKFFEDIDELKSNLLKDQRFYIFIADLDKFKSINDQLGHHVGDKLITMIAARLQDTFKQNDIDVYRFGGDEFALVIREFDETTAELHLYVAQTVLRIFNAPFVIDGNSLMANISIGSVECYHDDDVSLVELLRRAEIAMYHAKSRHLGYVDFSLAMLSDYKQDDFIIVNDIRKAFDTDEFYMEYQPKYNSLTNQITSAEALVRWHHPVLGIVSPNDFIHVAEENGVIDKLFLFTLRTAILDVLRLECLGIKIDISVNLSPKNITNTYLPTEISNILAEFNFPPSRLTLEITETGLVGNTDVAIKQLRAINKLGIKLSIDDYGTGYSSLIYLRQLPLNEIKIDQLFIRGMMKNKKDFAIVESTVKIAASMGYSVVAEGVESDIVIEELSDMGCHIIQGYHISRPINIDDFASFIDRVYPASKAKFSPLYCHEDVHDS